MSEIVRDREEVKERYKDDEVVRIEEEIDDREMDRRKGWEGSGSRLVRGSRT